MSIRNTSRICRVTLAAVALGAAFAASLLHAGKPPAESGPPVRYTMIFIPELTGVSGMNNYGDIVNGTMLYTKGLIYDLNQPINTALIATGGGVLSSVEDITDGWRIAGSFQFKDSWHAFRCKLAVGAGGIVVSEFERLVEPAEFPISYGYAINKWGEVVGQLQSLDAPPSNQWRAFRWPVGKSEAEIVANVFSEARDISDNGYITGFMYPAPQQHAFLYTPGNGETGVLTDLGTLPRCSASFGNGVNDEGQVAGDSTDPRPVHAFRCTSTVMVDLGTFSTDYWSHGGAINSAGDVVGGSVDRNHVSHAYLYTDVTKMLRLEPLIVNPAGLDPNSLSPAAVNDYKGHVYNGHEFGHIAGTARVNGVFGAFLLTPIP